MGNRLLKNKAKSCMIVQFHNQGDKNESMIPYAGHNHSSRYTMSREQRHRIKQGHDFTVSEVKLVRKSKRKSYSRNADILWKADLLVIRDFKSDISKRHVSSDY